MDDETPEMESVSEQMRKIMAAWVEDPSNLGLKRQFEELQRRYQRLFVEYKQGQLRNGAA